MVEIRPVIMEQEKYFPLLQEIEPSGEMVERNLREGDFTSWKQSGRQSVRRLLSLFPTIPARLSTWRRGRICGAGDMPDFW